MTTPPLHLTSSSPETEAYRCLQTDYALRKRRYLRILASQSLPLPEHDVHVPAMFRKYLRDREVEPGADPSKGWVRLRTRPDEEWRNRITAADHTRKAGRIDGKSSLWMDDALRRNDGMFLGNEEDVGIVTARLASPVLDDEADELGFGDDEEVWETPPFPPDNIFQRLLLPDARATAKELVRTIAELEVVQMVGGEMHGKTIREILLDRASHIEIDFTDAVRVASQPHALVIDPFSGTARSRDFLTELVPGLTTFLDSLHEPIVTAMPESRGDFVARWRGEFTGIDPSLLLDAYGIEFATTLLQLRRLYPNTTDITSLVDALAWLATLTQQTFRSALPALSDMVAFRSQPRWNPPTASWALAQKDTGWVAPAPPSREMLVDGDDFLYRTLVAQRERADATGERHFRMEPPPLVPAGWTWPAKEPAFIYWWRAILRGHCAREAMVLKDTADFHVEQLLRFAYLFDLFGPAPDSRVPRFVAECIRATLLHFKYWFDEPPASGNKGHEMTFWSENHQILFHSSQFLVGQLFPDEVFPRSGTTADGQSVTGREHLRRGSERLERWLDRRLALGFSEWCAPGYYNEDIPPVLNVVDFSRDERLATKAAMVADVLVFDLARNTCRGSFGVTAGRAYFEGKAYGWGQSVGEAIEVLFGTRGDHMRGENTAIALSTSPRYAVPDALLAIGRDRELLDRTSPMTFRSRVSIDPGEGPGAGVGFETDVDAAFWWGIGAYFDPMTLQLTRDVTTRYDNLRETTPLSLLFMLDVVEGYLGALLLDAAELVAGGLGAIAGQALLYAPFPVNLVAAVFTFGSLQLAIEGMLSLIVDLASMILYGLEALVDAILGEDPPKPKIPRAALQQAYDALLISFNTGNVLGRANLYTYSAGDAMLSSAQNHRAQAISLQKQPWMASLGCDACVWTNAPLEVSSNLATAGWEMFKRVITVQASRILNDFVALSHAGLDDMKEEGLRDWGGSICLPKVAQHKSVSIVAYNFPLARQEFSATYSHAWFPVEFFDEVDPAPENDELLPERAGGGTWVFGRKDDGYVALCSARRVFWRRDERFSDDPDPDAPGKTIGQGRFRTTELRAEDGSNIWVCAIGSRTQFGSFAAFRSRVRAAYLIFSGIGAIGQLQCTFDMPEAHGTGEPGFRWELFFGDDEAHLDGATHGLDDYPRFEGPYVEGRTAGRVEWRDPAYRIVHPSTGFWLSHDTVRAERETSEPQACAVAPIRASGRRKLRDAVALTAHAGSPTSTHLSPGTSATPALPRTSASRKRRFRLVPDP